MNKIYSTLVLFSCISVILSQTNGESDCQKDRAKALKSRSVINLVPNCKENGDYAELQCHSNSTWCQCWKKNGTPVTQPSRKIKRCDCLLAKHTIQSSGGPRNPDGPPNAYVPQCTGAGGYEKKQCHTSAGECWCVSDSGAQVGQKVKGTLNCQ